MGDYAFAADLDEGEVLFSRGGKILTRYDMKTLLFGGSVNIDVISVWCDYLNNGNSELICLALSSCLNEETLSAKLSSMIPKSHATYFVVAKEYVPNKSFSSVILGIYMMRHMETYNGNKCRYTLKLLKDRTDVKRYIVRVCNEILTWQDNIVKDQVTSKAKAYKNGCVIRNEVSRDLPYTDEHLMNFIRTNVANTDDIVVDTPWLQVTQEGMSTLFGGKWIMDMVIDLVGLRLTLERPNLVYFPTIIKDVVPKNSFQSRH
ncbi:uncharacterized protein LOC141628281 [Silene latifolia]|uniref:uncharacterized protein LOC141628281 n=1 Tax=Silene latifolia TaxID=37657 RepID=UPI003D77F06B